MSRFDRRDIAMSDPEATLGVDDGRTVRGRRAMLCRQSACWGYRMTSDTDESLLIETQKV